MLTRACWQAHRSRSSVSLRARRRGTLHPAIRGPGGVEEMPALVQVRVVADRVR
jgi:hypothetical protein